MDSVKRLSTLFCFCEDIREKHVFFHVFMKCQTGVLLKHFAPPTQGGGGGNDCPVSRLGSKNGYLLVQRKMGKKKEKMKSKKNFGENIKCNTIILAVPLFYDL